MTYGLSHLLSPNFVLMSLVLSCMVETMTSDEAWPQWRGPFGTGVAADADPPVEWSETKNIRWKAKLPGKGHSTPIIWGDRIFLTTAIPVGDVLPAGIARLPELMTVCL